ncbi:MAG TPA: Uma2 family endonuclease [Candidatus Cybelea sp.]|nr:Uma2 family endonuclease [Candidatus Cybelea sp.]
MQLSDHRKPYLEYHAGRPVRKLSLRTKHALVQGALLVILRRGAGSAYRVGTEWECDLTEARGTKTLLVPDVAAIATKRLMDLAEARRDSPPFAPDLVVEVRSPNDREREREWKLRVPISTREPPASLTCFPANAQSTPTRGTAAQRSAQATRSGTRPRRGCTSIS